jgi:hypothetical protein
MRYFPLITSLITMGLAKWAALNVGFSSGSVNAYILTNFLIYGVVGLYYSSKIGKYPEIENFRKNIVISPFKPVRLAHLPPKIKKSILNNHPEIKSYQTITRLSFVFMFLHFLFGIYLGFE